MTRRTTHVLLLALPLLLAAAGPQVTVHKVDESTATGTLAALADGKVVLESPAATIPLDDVVDLTTAAGNAAASAVAANAPAHKLTGGIIGTTGSWQDNGSTRENVFDGNFDTYFAAPQEHLADAWVGLDFGSPKFVTEVKYAPRPGQFAKRMIGGKIQGSNDPDFKSATDLVTITSAPPDHTLTTAAVKTPGSFRYVRYVSAEKGCNIAELEIWGKDQAPAPVVASSSAAAKGLRKLSGKVLGTDGSFNDDPSTTKDKAFDGDLDTFFDAPKDARDDAWVGLDLGSPQVIAQIKYAPRNDPGTLFLKRMVGGKFQGSNTADFSSGVVDLHTISKRPARGTLTTVPVTVKTAFRYVRYLSPEEGCGNVAEVEFWAGEASAVAAATSAPTNKSTTKIAKATTAPVAAASQPASAPFPAQPTITAIFGDDDDRLRGSLAAWTDKSLTLKPEGLTVTVELPVASLHELWRGSPEQIQQAKALPLEPGPEDAAYVLKGNEIVVVRGIALGVDGDALQFKFNDEPRKIALAKLVGVTFGGPNAAATRKRDKSFHQTFQLAGDNTLSGRWLAYDAKASTFILQTTWGQRVPLPFAAVQKIRSANGRLTYLTDLKPVAVDQAAYFDRLFPYRVDKSLTGGPIKLIDGEYARGLSVHARCALTYDLDGQYEEFKTKVGFQQPEGKLGHCPVRVLADGQTLWQSPDARGDAPKPAELSLKVAGVKQLTLEVDFGPDADTGDRVAWANPRLLRAAAAK